MTGVQTCALPISPAGFFVRLDSNGLEGFVNCKTLDGRFSFDPVTLRLVHNKNGRIFQLEQPVAVSFAGVDDERKQILFNLVEAPAENATPATEPDNTGDA